MFIIQLFQIIVLILSAVIHEYMHGWMADRLGDPTAKNAGRLSLNPLAHIDLFGSILLPFILIASGVGFVFGWAKPVPFNPYNLSDQKYGSAKVAVAGPAGNFFVALVFGLALRFFGENLFGISPILPELFSLVVFINILLGIFNLVPIPPMDGSKILMAFLPFSWQEKFLEIERYGMFLVLAFVMFGYSLIFPIIVFLYGIIVG